jgi:hypothetical protein
MVKQDSDHVHAARTNGCLTSRFVILTCLIALPVPAVAQAPPAPATLGPAVVVLHISGHVPQPGGAVALLLADGSRLPVAATDIDEALTHSANDTLNGKQARGRTTRRDTAVVIHITARVPNADGSIAVLLASGSKIVLASSHIDAQLTRSINNRINVTQARGGPPPNQSPRLPGPEPGVFPPTASDQAALTTIDDASIESPDRALPPSVTAQCTERWPDFAMQEYCLEEQQDAADALDRRSRATVTAPRLSRECARRWPDDFAMRDYCERTYVETPWWMSDRR